MKIATFIILTFCVTSCLKRNEENINATCADSCMTFNIRVATGQNSITPLANSVIELGWTKPATPLGDPGRLIARAKTSTNGFVNFSFKALPKELKGGKFYVTCGERNDYFYQQDEFYEIEKYDTVINANLHVPSKATLKIIYKNFHPTTPSDYFQCSPVIPTYGSGIISVKMVKPGGQQGSTYFLASDPPFSILELTGSTAGNQYTYLEIIRKKNGIRFDLEDSIYIQKGETKTYEVDF